MHESEGEEARGPHLPDAVDRLPWLAWVFVLLGLGYLIWFVRSPNVVPNPTAADMVVAILRVIPALTAILLPAALLARHPDAARRLRTVLLGTILFAAVQGLLILSEPLQPAFESLTPASEELPFVVPLSATYSAFVGFVTALGLALVALGLSQARRFEDVSGVVVSLFVPVASVLATVGGVLAVSRLDLGDTPMSPPLAIYLASLVVVEIAQVAIWAYFAAVVTRGWRAGEEPTMGWVLGVLAAGLVIAALGLVYVNGFLVDLNELSDGENDAFVTIYGYVVATAYALGHVFLLSAFAAGLPELDEVEDDEDDEFVESDTSDDRGSVLDEDGWPVVADPRR
jgi:hypothetical protein